MRMMHCISLFPLDVRGCLKYLNKPKGAQDERLRMDLRSGMKHLKPLWVAVSVAVLISGLSPARATPTDLQFNQVVEDFVFGTLSLSPTTATGIGYHKHQGAALDDLLEDFSPAGIKASLKLLSDIETRIAKLDAKSLSAEQRADIDIMHDAIEATRLD